jgi:hypothetical protein
MSGGGDNLDIAELKKQMKEGKSNILVAVRIRPLAKNELIISNHETVNVEDNKMVYLNDPQFEMSPNDVNQLLQGSSRES